MEEAVFWGAFLLKTVFMKQSSILLTITLCTFFIPLFAQSSPFKSPKARQDSVRAFQHLEQSQLYLDSSNFAAALQWAKDAEQMLQSYAAESSYILTDVYCLQGLSLIRTNRGEAFALWRKVEALPKSANKLTQANALYFIGTCQLYSNQYPQTRETYQQALDLYLSCPAPYASNVGRIYTNLGFMALNESNTEDLIQYSEQAIVIWTKNQGPFFPGLAHPYNNRGVAYYNKGLLKEALADHQKAMGIRMRILPPNHPDIGASLNNLGLVSFSQGALKDAQIYYLRALDIFQTAKDTASWAKAANNIGMISTRLQEFSEARRYYEQTLFIEKANPFTKKADIALTLFNIGVSLREEGDFAQALDYFQQAQKLLGKKHPNYTNVLSSIGRCLEATGQYPAALEKYELAYQLQLEQYGQDNPMLATYLFNQASIQLVTGNLPKALALNRQAQQNLGYKGGSNSSYVLLLLELCTVLTQESQILYQSIPAQQDTVSVKNALYSAQQALLAYQHFSQINAEPSVKLIAKAAAIAATEVAIATNHQLYGQTKNISYWYAAFHHAERSKSTLLLESMQRDQMVQNSQANPLLLKQESLLRGEIAQKDIFIQEKLAKKTNPLDSLLVRASLERGVLMARHDSLFQKIVQSDTRFTLRTESVASLQESLITPQQTLLEYFVGQNDLYLFLVQTNHFEVITLPLNFPLAQWVDSLQQGIFGYYALSDHQRSAPLEISVNEYTHYAQLLYQKLIEPVMAKTTQEWIVIPDGVLGYVPFEALLTKAPERRGNFGTYHYLLNEKTISYSYSASMLRQMREKKHLSLPNASVLALAPFNRGDTLGLKVMIDSTDEMPTISLRDALGPLLQSGQEAAQVAEIWTGKALFGTEVSIEKFWELAPQYRILHLSTHGKADDRNGDFAYLALAAEGDSRSYEKLYARNLNAATLNADVAILSACETSLGKWRPGEGIGSLAHAFARAGAKSLVTSLWKVDERPSKAILLDFHRYLKAGKPKNEALSQAKLDYLTQKKKKEIADMHPFFWAGFIGIGDMRAMR